MIRRDKIILIVILTLIALIVWITPMMGYYLVVEDPLEEADLIVVLMGSVPARVLEAADIYGEGFARELVMVQSFVEAADELSRRGVVIPGHAELTRDAAIQMGVPESRIKILPGGARSTKDEALVLREYLEQNSEIERVILVTSSFHSRRTKIIFERFCGGLAQDVQFMSRPSKYDSFQEQHWWFDRESAKMVMLEYLKLGHFYLLERWQ
ncbi:MAG: YdcF family protein [Dethiobacteria bacterium]|nr:YdcF family protein [Dethiobacteria bacterium]